MMIRITLAWRNLLRNFRRTLLNLTMIVSGFAAIVIFQGFGESIIAGLRMAFIEIQYGHIQVGTDISWERRPVDNANEMLIADPQKIIEQTKNILPLKYVVGRLGFFAMISTGQNSVSAAAVGFDPSIETTMRDGLIMVSGNKLMQDDAYEIMLSEGLANSIQAKPGDQLTLLAQTVDGSMNALDVEMAGIANTGVAEIDNMTFYVPIKTAQKLLDTDRVERLVYALDTKKHFVEKEAKLIQEKLPAGLTAKTWFQLARLYQQTDEYFAAQNIIVSMIILVLVLLSISNTVSNSVIERTGEIGTVRALGDKKKEIVTQFLMEGALLSIISGVLAVIVSALVSKVLSNLGVTLPIPGTSQPIPLGIEIIPKAYIQAFLLTSCTAMFATFWPAWKVAKLPIVEALKRNV